MSSPMPQVADCNGCTDCRPADAAITKLCRYTKEPITSPMLHCQLCESCNLYPCSDATRRIDEQVAQIDWVDEAGEGA